MKKVKFRIVSELPVNSVLNLPNRRVKFCGEIIQITEELNQS